MRSGDVTDSGALCGVRAIFGASDPVMSDCGASVATMETLVTRPGGSARRHDLVHYEREEQAILYAGCAVLQVRADIVRRCLPLEGHETDDSRNSQESLNKIYI